MMRITNSLLNPMSVAALIRQLGKGCIACVIVSSVLMQAQAQPSVLSYAHRVIDTLTSPAMDGRGYVDSSDFKAAIFIRNEFESMQVSPLADDFFQPFHLDVNVFPGRMQLRVNKHQLTAGKDFLVDAASNEAHGKFKVVPIPHDSRDTSLDAVANQIQWLIDQAGKKEFVSINKADYSKHQWAMLKEQLDKYGGFAVKGYLLLSDDKLTWDAAQDRISPCMLHVKSDVLTSPPRKIKVNIEEQFKESYLTRNVMAYVRGTLHPDSFLVFTSHYDHLGQMGDGTYFPGANDNASGTSMVLNLAKYYAAHPPKYSVAFICFSGEEAGLVGSTFYAAHPAFPLDKIKFLINLDIVGTGDEGIKVVNATEFPAPFERLVKLNDREQLLKVVSPRGAAANSDHYPFYVKGVPCFFIYTMGGISAYHDIYDRAATLPLTRYEALFRLLVDFENEF